jgi:endonuclease YncB( thermonuclease family)
MTGPREYPGCRIVRVVDGDSLEVDVDLGFRMTCRMPLRLAHVDAPERGTTAGKAARAWLSELLDPIRFGMPLLVRTYKPYDKYGRWLAEVILPSGESVAELMVTAGHAVPYEGGPRG